MSRNAFQQKLEALHQELEHLGHLVQAAIAASVSALVARDLEGAQMVIDGDRQINETHARIERTCLELVALQQPMASDLRRIAATLKVITDLERMADHAVDIARVVKRMGGRPLVKPLVDIPMMATLVQEMVRDALTAFLTENRTLVDAMIQKDHEVDHLHAKVISDLETLMRQDSKTISQGVQLLFVSSALERIGDHATNLGEWLIYLETGERTELNQ